MAAGGGFEEDVVDDVDVDECEGDGPFPGGGREEGWVCVEGEADDDDEKDGLNCEVEEGCEDAGTGAGDLVGCGNGLVGVLKLDDGGEIIQPVLVGGIVHLVCHTGVLLSL